MEPVAFLLGVLAFSFCVWFIVWLVILLPYRMAEARNREGTAWVLVSLIGSPFLAIIALWLLGTKS